MFSFIGLYGIEVLTLNKMKELPFDLAEKLAVPGEIMPWTGKFTLTGGKRALLENHRGILEYGDTRIVAAVGRGKLVISGTALQLKAMNRSEILISGKIQTVEWE